MWAVFRTLFASFIRRYPLLLDLPQRRTLISDWQGFWTFDREPAWITFFENCLHQLWLECRQSNQGNTHTHQKKNNPCLSRWQGLFFILFILFLFCWFSAFPLLWYPCSAGSHKSDSMTMSGPPAFSGLVQFHHETCGFLGLETSLLHPVSFTSLESVIVSIALKLYYHILKTSLEINLLVWCSWK